MSERSYKTLPMSGTIREVVGIFGDFDSMHRAVEKLETSGFNRRHISVLGNEEALKNEYGTSTLPPELLEDDPSAPKSTLPRKEELGIATGALIGGGAYAGVAAALLAAGGAVVTGGLVALALAAGAGGAIAGGILAKLLGDEYADFFQKQIDKGGLLLWVRIHSQKEEADAISILQQDGAHDVHVHEIPADKY